MHVDISFCSAHAICFLFAFVRSFCLSPHSTHTITIQATPPPLLFSATLHFDIYAMLSLTSTSTLTLAYIFVVAAAAASAAICHTSVHPHSITVVTFVTLNEWNQRSLLLLSIPPSLAHTCLCWCVCVCLLVLCKSAKLYNVLYDGGAIYNLTIVMRINWTIIDTIGIFTVVTEYILLIFKCVLNIHIL